MTGSNRKSWAALLVILACVAAFMLWLRHDHDERERKLALARAVRVLPPGAEAAWTAYEDRRFNQDIQVQGDVVRVAPLGGLGAPVFVSRNMPYQVTCFRQWIFIDFGQGNNSTTVPLGGLNLPRSEQPPGLGVDPDSVAARRLWDVLCARTTAHMQEVMAPGAANTTQ